MAPRGLPCRLTPRDPRMFPTEKIQAGRRAFGGPEQAERFADAGAGAGPPLLLFFFFFCDLDLEGSPLMLFFPLSSTSGAPFFWVLGSLGQLRKTHRKVWEVGHLQVLMSLKG